MKHVKKMRNAMNKQILKRFILAFMLLTAALSTAQETQIDTSKIPDEVTFLNDSGNPKFAPRGIYAITKPPFDNAPTIETWRNECLDGVAIRRYWKDLNPEAGVYEWKELDSMFELAKTFSKKNPSYHCPGVSFAPMGFRENMEECHEDNTYC
jgi:hypothetical protein